LKRSKTKVLDRKRRVAWFLIYIQVIVKIEMVILTIVRSNNLGAILVLS